MRHITRHRAHLHDLVESGPVGAGTMIKNNSMQTRYRIRNLKRQVQLGTEKIYKIKKKKYK